ncbi:MAG: hypothetical protein Edafosvirus16_13 [Edafosvirus sp.]|uniref:Uncharacterized protein n=1 Tax=Edafosvirus sp. TaxID=2487765 RepID=A0A3G4ZVY2_9VIRU|nr:MAG: hypothetical protein Edafosvirus16_13 [Edafosvirus sp.]
MNGPIRCRQCDGINGELFVLCNCMENMKYIHADCVKRKACKHCKKYFARELLFRSVTLDNILEYFEWFYVNYVIFKVITEIIIYFYGQGMIYKFLSKEVTIIANMFMFYGCYHLFCLFNGNMRCIYNMVNCYEDYVITFILYSVINILITTNGNIFLMLNQSVLILILDVIGIINFWNQIKHDYSNVSFELTKYINKQLLEQKYNSQKKRRLYIVTNSDSDVESEYESSCN